MLNEFCGNCKLFKDKSEFIFKKEGKYPLLVYCGCVNRKVNSIEKNDCIVIGGQNEKTN